MLATFEKVAMKHPNSGVTAVSFSQQSWKCIQRLQAPLFYSVLFLLVVNQSKGGDTEVFKIQILIDAKDIEDELNSK